MGSGMIGNGEYLPAGTDTSELPYTQASAGEGVTLKDYKREDSHAEFWCENILSEDSYVECSFLYYPGYRAVSAETGEHLAVVPGGNNVLRVKYRQVIRAVWQWILSEKVTGRSEMRFRRFCGLACWPLG